MINALLFSEFLHESLGFSEIIFMTKIQKIEDMVSLDITFQIKKKIDLLQQGNCIFKFESDKIQLNLKVFNLIEHLNICY